MAATDMVGLRGRGTRRAADPPDRRMAADASFARRLLAWRDVHGRKDLL